MAEKSILELEKELRSSGFFDVNFFSKFPLNKLDRAQIDNLSSSLKVIKILAPFDPDEETVFAAFLYPLFSNGLISSDLIRKKFGHAVFVLLESLHNLKNLNYEENDSGRQIEILKKMFLGVAKDMRPILLAMSYRLYELQQIGDLNTSFTKTIAEETLKVYVPVAARLGIYKIKVKLEDLAFKHFNPQDYHSISDQLTKLGKSRFYAIEFIKKDLEKFLKLKGVEAEVSGRVKSIYSIYKKLKNKGVLSLEALFDIFAMRIVVPTKFGDDGEESVDHIYALLGQIHSRWKPVPKRFKDYIAMPKPNGYMSLHTVILGISPKKRMQPVEIQIRSEQMHKQAEYGVASHWLYKDKTKLEQNLDLLKGLKNINLSIEEEGQEVKEVELDIFDDRIFVLTPKGEVKDLPAFSTPIDFAYSVHTDLGNHCVMAKVNGQIVPLSSTLKNGDVVDIMVKKDSKPKIQWLSFVKSSSAKQKIKSWFNSLNRDSNIKRGKKLVNQQLLRLGKKSLDQSLTTLKGYLGRNLSVSERENLLEEVGKGAQMAVDVVRKIFPYEENLIEKKAPPKKEKKKDSKTVYNENDITKNILVGGEADLPLKLSSCCKPVEGELIMAYVTRGNRISVHSMKCKLLGDLDRRRFIKASWKNTSLKDKLFKVRILIRSVSRVGLMRDITAVISRFGINIIGVEMKPDDKNFMNDYYTLEMEDYDLFDVLLDSLEDVEGILSVKRA